MDSLTKQVSLCRTHQLARRAASAPIRVTPDYTSRNSRVLTAHQAGNARQLVGHGFLSGVHFVAVIVPLAAIVDGDLHPRNSDRHLRQTLAPGTPKAVSDDHRNV